MRLYTFLIAVMLIVGVSCTGEVAELHLIERMEDIPIPRVNPMSAPDDWLLAHIDVETTGLLPGYHEMIDIGLVMTDLEGEILDSLYLRILPNFPERLSEGAYRVNAFNPEKWKLIGALHADEAVDSILSFHTKVAGNKSVLMVAYNSQFDGAFLDHLFRVANRTWREMYHYYILDIPSMAWGLGLTDLSSEKLMAYYDIEDEPHVAELHTGITGAMVNVRIYRALLRYREEQLKHANHIEIKR